MRAGRRPRSGSSGPPWCRCRATQGRDDHAAGADGRVTGCAAGSGRGARCRPGDAGGRTSPPSLSGSSAAARWNVIMGRPAAAGQPGARVLRFPGPRSHGSLAMASPAAGAGPLPVPLYVGHQLVRPDLTLGEAPIRDGAVVSLGSPEGCAAPERAGLVEIRVMSGPDGRLDPPAGRRPLRYRQRPGGVVPHQGPRPSPRSRCGSSSTAGAAARSRRMREYRLPLDREPLDRAGAVAAWPGHRRRRLTARAGVLRAAGRGAAPVAGRLGASTSTGRRGCCRRRGPPGSSCRRRRRRPSAARCPVLMAVRPAGHGRRPWRSCCTRCTCWRWPG